MLKSICLLLVCLCVLLPLVTSGANSWADEVIIESVEVRGLSSMPKEQFLELLGLHAGQILDPDLVRVGIKRAFLTMKFNDIVVSTKDEAPSQVIVDVDEKYVISDIGVEGNRLLRKSEVRKNFRIREKQYLYPQELTDAVEALRKSLVDKGFPAIRIDGSIRYQERKRRAKITLVVHEGEPLFIRKIVLKGVEAPEEIERILIKLKVYAGDVFDRERLKGRLEKLEAYYREEGHYDPVFGPFTYSDGLLQINVSLGNTLDVTFDGNSHFSDRRLREELSFWEAGSIRNEIVEESVSRIVTLYHNAGFVFAQIAPVIETLDGQPTAVFFIYEGPQVSIDSISIEGTTIEDWRIKEILNLKEDSHFNPDAMDGDANNLLEFYYALGFAEAEVKEFRYEYDESRTKASIFIKIEEGSQIMVREVRVEGNQKIPDADIFNVLAVAPLAPYNEIDIADSRFAILSLYKSRGYLDAEVEVMRHFRTNRVSIMFQVHEGRRYFFGYSIIRGNVTVKSEVISRQLLNRKGEPFNLVLLQRNSPRLYKLGLFSDVDYNIVDDEGSTKSVLVDVQEGNAGAVEFGIGYGDYEKYRGFFDIGYRNFFGMNREGKFRTELTTISEKFIVSAYEPWLYYIPGAYGPVSMRINFIRDRRTEENIDTGNVIYKVRKYAATTELAEYFSERVRGSLLYSFSVVNTYNIQPDAELTREDTGSVNISKIGPGIVYDSRDSAFNPRRGIMSSLTVQYASKLIFSETDFLKTELSFSNYHALSKRVVLAFSVRSGVAQGFRDTRELPIVERYFLGGRNTVRGYAQDSLGPKGVDGTPTGGNVYVMDNVELRFDIGWGIGLVTFLDSGNVWLTTGDIDMKDYKSTVGIGLRYNTPVGPLRVDYGHKLDREDGESKGEFHFSIGHAF